MSSFTKAARKHYVAQTAISQQIAKLEHTLQVKLFEREKNRVVLTDAGRIFYEDVMDIITRYEMATEKVQRYFMEHKKIITIGFKERHELQLLTKVVQEFHAKHPQVEFVIKEGTGGKLIEEVKHGICDLFVNISCTFTEDDKEILDHYTIYHGNMLLAVSCDHPFAQREYVEGSELKNEKFIILNVDNLNRGFDAMYEHSRKDGYEVQILSFVSNIGAQLMMVELNQGVAFVQDLLTQPQDISVKFLPIHNSAHHYDVDVVWNKENDDVYVKQFLQFIRKKLPRERA